jgi:hypothetical protein
VSNGGEDWPQLIYFILFRKFEVAHLYIVLTDILFYLSGKHSSKMTYEEIIWDIKNCSITDSDEFDLFIDDIAIAYENLNLSLSQKEQLVEQLFLNIENQPEPEFTSWSLIHFIESFDDSGTNYNAQLLRSLKRTPKVMTILLVNRNLNALPNPTPERALFLAALNEIASNNTIDEHLKNEAKDFYEYQMKKDAGN